MAVTAPDAVRLVVVTSAGWGCAVEFGSVGVHGGADVLGLRVAIVPARLVGESNAVRTFFERAGAVSDGGDDFADVGSLFQVVVGGDDVVEGEYGVDGGL